MKPVADYTPCTLCGHPLALECSTRGCRQIIESGHKRREDNILCGCFHDHED